MHVRERHALKREYEPRTYLKQTIYQALTVMYTRFSYTKPPSLAEQETYSVVHMIYTVYTVECTLLYVVVVCKKGKEEYKNNVSELKKLLYVVTSIRIYIAGRRLGIY